MGDDYKDSTKLLSEQDSFFIHAQEKEDKSRIDWYYIEIYQGRQETETLQRQLTDKQYDPAEILHVLFDYTFFDRVIAGEYDWRVGNDKVLKDKCKGYISKAESVKKEIQSFPPEGPSDSNVKSIFCISRPVFCNFAIIKIHFHLLGISINNSFCTRQRFHRLILPGCRFWFQ